MRSSAPIAPSIPSHGATTAGAGAVWVISAREGTVTRIDPTTNSVTATVHVGVNPGGIGVGAGAVWVADYLGAALVRLDQTTGQVVTTVKLAGLARKVSVSPDAVWVAVANASDATLGTLVRVDPKTNAIVASIPLKADPWGVASAASVVWVAAKGVSDAIWVNPATNTIGGRVPLRGGSIGVDVGGSTAWLVGQTPPGVVRIDFSGGTQGPPAATPPTSATPSPTPSPLAGGNLVVTTYVTFRIPADWVPSSSSDPEGFAFVGPNGQVLVGSSAPTGSLLDEVVGSTISLVKRETGADPEANESIAIDSVPGKLLTWHFLREGRSLHMLWALWIKGSREYGIIFSKGAGTESEDRALFLSVLSSLRFTSAAG